MKIKLDPGAYMPERAHNTDAGLDIKSPALCLIPAKDSVTIDTGVHIELPPNAAEKSETEEEKEKTQLSGSIKISGAIKDVADIMLQKIDKVVGSCEVTVTIEFGA